MLVKGIITHYPARTEISTGATVVGGLDTRAGADEDLKAILADAADPYATLRSVYLQYRQGEVDEIRGGATLPALPDIDESAPAPSAPSGSPSPSGKGEASPPSALDQAAPLERLPDQQGGQANGQVASPLDE